VVNGWESAWAKSFPAFVAADVPLWIWWGFKPAVMLEQKFMPPYKPRSDEVDEARRTVRPVPFATPPRELEDNVGEQQQEAAQQRKQQHLLTEGHNHQYLQTEGADDRSVREENERKAELERFALTLEEPNVGVAIFEWRTSKKGNQIRELVPRREWKARWGLYRPEERTYDGVTDEWDLERVQEDDYMYDDEDPPMDTDVSPPVPMNASPSAAPNINRSAVQGALASRPLEKLARNERSDGETYGEDIRSLFGDRVPESSFE
jgi:hypothetical protein